MAAILQGRLPVGNRDILSLLAEKKLLLYPQDKCGYNRCQLGPA
jgi:hypothetical protein